MKGRDVYTPVPRDEAMRRAKQDNNIKFIKIRWVEVAKADAVSCRFVGQEFASQDPREDLFAGTPPLHAARMVVPIAATTCCYVLPLRWPTTYYVPCATHYLLHTTYELMFGT